MLAGSLNIAGQISVAPNPVTAGTFGSSFSYSNTQNSQNYRNYYGRSTNDVAYKFTLTTGMNMVISNCGSSVSDTYLYLLNASGNGISSNDDYSGTGACSNTYHSRIAQTLPAGTYYVISEGYSSNGSITTNITGTAAGISGNTFQSPISAGSFSAAFSYSNTQNTTGFTNTFGRATNDVFYRFSVSVQMDVTITHCGSSLSDTYMYLLNVNGNSIDSNDDYSGTGACSNTYNSVIKKTLSAGTYYIVSEGYSSNGLITTNITGTPAVNNTTGNTFQNPIIMGTYGSSFNYSNSQNTVNFTNTYGQSSNDVFYKFTLSLPMTVTINHCNSTLSDTYLHLLDAGGNRIAYNDDYSGTGACSNTYRSYLKKELGAGTYYVVSEGYSSNGVIVTTVTGELQAVGIEYSYDASGNRTARHPVASMFSAVSNLRSSEVKYNKEGIISDPGRDASKDEVKHPNSAIDITVEDPAFAVKIYPNPTDGLVTVSIPDYRTEKKGEIRLYDFAGRSLYTSKIASEMEIIDLSGYIAGMYTIKVSIDGKTTVHKIIRNRK
ncbi:hypothetical protein FACS1894123_08900 [Bacteroidia bacterium]|nr:hypothetical protein FACS1894123_08900 [Bacteroidia bacterium]